MSKLKRRSIDYERKKSMAGFFFMLPWLLGFLFITMRALITMVAYSFSKTTITTVGMQLEFIGFDNFIKAFKTDLDFSRNLTSEISKIAYNVPIIVAFSLFMAVLLNNEFKGRTIARAIFFIPVIVGSGGIILSFMNGDSTSGAMMSGERSSMLFSATSLSTILRESGVSEDFVDLVNKVTSNVYNITWHSGLQIVLNIAGLKSVSPQLYEAADVEGASSWEKFWKITFPLLMPILMINLIYTIIDSFTDYNNSVMAQILNLGRQLQFAYSSALSVIYFIIVSVVVVIVYFIINKRITYTVN